MADEKILVQDQSINYFDFIVLTAGIDFTRFKKNPVMLFMHDMNKLIGKWVELTVEGDKVYAKPVFNSKNAFAKEKQQEYVDGFLNGVSLGLKPLQWENGSKYGLGDNVLVLAKSICKEISMATIGANENTVQLYGDDENIITEQQIKEIKLSVASKPSQQQNTNTMDFKTLLLTTLKLAANSTDAEIATALQTMANSHVTLTAENKQLKDEKEANQANLINETVQLAITAGKITDAQKPVYESLLKADFKNGKAALDAIPGTKQPETTAAVNLNAVIDKTIKTETHLNTGGAGDQPVKTLSWYFKNDVAALNKMKKDNKDEYIKLCAASGVPEEAIEW